MLKQNKIKGKKTLVYTLADSYMYKITDSHFNILHDSTSVSAICRSNIKLTDRWPFWFGLQTNNAKRIFDSEKLENLHI